MSRVYKIALVALALIIVASAAVFVIASNRKVEVTTGEIIECTYGHIVSEDVKTLRVPAREASKYGVRTVKTVCDEHAAVEEAYAEAQAALKKADLETAKRKLEEVLALDPAYRQAQSQLDAIVAGKKPSADSEPAPSANDGDSATKPSTPGDDADPTGPVASLTGWMPDDLDGYQADKMLADVLAVSRQYAGSGGRTLVISAEQLGTEEIAKSIWDRDYKLRYAKNAKTLKINGKNAYGGTDGSEVAVLGIVDGPVLVVLQLSSDDVEPPTLLSELTAMAKGLPR